MSEADKILREALTLPRDERLLVIRKLIESLETAADDDVQSAWAHEIERRVEAIRAGRSESVDAEDVHARIRAALARH